MSDSAADIRIRPTLDVSGLPSGAMDWNAPVWWGNTLLIFIETTTLVLLLAAYFYIRRNFHEWPPPKVDVVPPIQHPLPLWRWGTANLVVTVLGCLPMIWTELAARRKQQNKVRIGLIVMMLIALASTVLRFYEFPATLVHWNDNAYGSVVWTILGAHMTYDLAATLEFGVMGVWVLLNGLDDKHALDVTLAGVYWYWVAATWVLIYLVIYISPRVM
jgi:cytochrome c oxidase subunit III